MRIITETQRLILREIEETDEAGMYELDSDPEVHQYLGNKPVTTIEESRNAIALIRRQYEENGTGRWAVIEKSEGRFIGWAGLKLYRDEINGHSNFLEVGYRLIKKYWGKGYATEAAQTSVVYGFERLHAREIFGMADANNAASIKVLEKCGMTHTGNFMPDGTDHVWYVIKDPRRITF